VWYATGWRIAQGFSNEVPERVIPLQCPVDLDNLPKETND